jgi:hypothetical protein
VIPQHLSVSNERFWSNVDASNGHDSCWEWRAFCQPRRGNNLSYGTFKVGGKAGRAMLAHRVAYELAIGPIPPKAVIRHTCDNPKCCNPAHLVAGSQRDNVGDAMARGRHRPPKTKRIRFVTHAGETHSLSEWSRKSGIKVAALGYRVRRGRPLFNPGELSK